jgi:hypothetical protein
MFGIDTGKVRATSRRVAFAVCGGLRAFSFCYRWQSLHRLLTFGICRVRLRLSLNAKHRFRFALTGSDRLLSRYAV